MVMWPTRVDVDGARAGSPRARSGAPPGVPAGASGRAYLDARRRAENFPVALRLLPPGPREHLTAVYDVVRVIDDLGDDAGGDRTALLLAFRRELDLVWSGRRPPDPVLRRLARTVVQCGLSRQPFLDLVEANLRDQTTTAYPTYEALLEYCALSANPVGRIVLEVFGASTPERVVLSDRICTALQIIEHCQDVEEDLARGRVYLPLTDLNRFDVSPTELADRRTSAAVRRLVAFEADRADALLRSGLPLLRELRGTARLAVAGYAAGGRAALSALRRTGPPRQRSTVRRRDVAAELARLWVGAHSGGRGRP
jgi:squalene synthase HpnC